MEEFRERLNTLWLEYKALKRQGEEGEKQASRFYQEQIWPVLLERWLSDPPIDRALPDFKASIHTLGTSPEATMLAIAATKAERVFLLHTAESYKFVERIRNELSRDISAREVPKSDPAELYRKVSEILKEVAGGPFAFDITSGTKAMTAGLAAAAFFAQERGLDVCPVYVDNDDYDQEARRPKPGSERLISLLNPYKVLGDLDFEKARTLYQAGNFGQAKSLFDTIANQTGDHRTFKPYAHLAQAYNLWYNNHFAEAKESFASLFHELDKPAYRLHDLQKHKAVLERQCQAVDLLAELPEAYQDDVKRLAKLADTDTMLWLLATLRVMQARFAQTNQGAQNEAGNYTAAGLLCYRGLEVASQHRLAHRGFDSLKPDYQIFEMPREELERRYQEAWKQVATKQQAKDPRPFPQQGEPIPLFEGYLLLRALNDELTRRPIYRQLMGLANLRNESLWIHGYAPITKQDYRQIQGIFEKILGELLELEAPGRSFLKNAEPVPLA